MTYKTSTIDDEKESEDEDIDLVSKKFMKYIKLDKIKWRRSQSKKESSNTKKKKKAMMVTWSNSEESFNEEYEDGVDNMCFMALKDHKDKVDFLYY